MFQLVRNYVKIAVDRLGGPTKTATALGVSGTTIHDWVRRARVVDITKAKLLAQLSGLEVQQLRSTQ